ncbi:Uncharacterized protein OS=Singulisphaera acidiphila (strain ATCC BAA-1392 / DSM 18658 / VKM B-2454 / MOB10) GN=Sinac_2187 PE=4 SV=1 [Gemmataceae bacterium]|nr:Uncharacterized protein OS=Singulisphaera acidiphila (strain ATCC BAA-1392 / DSM 18658 / VKM B-2454 / MOB10) GN=Sinac_2187 PE=4 SV=1 [Gemmataceae bacterium]VTU02541.1 Uncharacterized protein OS=Singulisphaera acidiphila (strain ATCC BAA-1392 / DSM 18658 / VKM B-2454 / MOB10) GN=Sinac_2187 PE=4 SV=1 [Gemmataceae bacterium]
MRMRNWGKMLVRVGTVLLPLTLAACQTLIQPHRGDECDPDCVPGRCHDHVKVCKNPTMQALGSDLERLEKHIDLFGSVVPKVPDVWGQARLTQYREEFERVMQKDLEKFDVNLQGSLARADQSFFQQSVALSAAVSGGVATRRVPPGVRGTASATPVDTTQQVLLTPIEINETKLPDLVKDVEGKTDFFKDASGSFVRPNFVGFKEGAAGTPGTLNIGIEPTLYLAQKKRYLDFLNQLRRENEGDDTADSPGYSLNLVRLPVSVLPGRRTDEGHGAEVTFTIDPILGDDLLPMTFRNLVINDLLHQLGFPLTQFLNDREVAGAVLRPEVGPVLPNLRTLIASVTPVVGKLNELILTAKQTEDERPVFTYVESLKPLEKELLGSYAILLPVADRNVILYLLRNSNPLLSAYKLGDTPAVSVAEVYDNLPPADRSKLKEFAPEIVARAENRNTGEEAKKLAAAAARRPVVRNQPVPPSARQALDIIKSRVEIPAVPYSPGLVNKTGFPISQLIDVYGLENCFQIAYAANSALRESIDRQRYAHLPDIQAFLQQEALAAYRFLAEQECQVLWQQFCTPELVSAVRTRKVDRLQELRKCYVDNVAVITRGNPHAPKNPLVEEGQYGTTAALAWCILVDSALLTDRLIRDMKETATSKQQSVPGCDQWLPYYHPCPPPEAREAFNCYVKLRWPIHVFALDPASQDQNLADSLLTRRETQLALSMAFTSGQINARTLTRYARRLEAQYDTIALNRTQVGFAHGENTFGWRFYPRFQTPDTEGNLTTLFRDQLVGGPSRNALLRQRRLEPGPRECVAVVMMPSFVPYMTVDSVSNWFGLANPKHKVLDQTQALDLSQTVQTLKRCGPNVGDAGCYRDGEFGRLLRRAEQLEARLPTQTMSVPVPVLNTLGGFEMFSNGTTDLAPELYGWYGAPGVDARKTTTLFLVGDHFSPLRTRVIVGNKEVPDVKKKMLSRQVMQVEVAADQVVLVDRKDGNKRYVQAHVATPYGVTRELVIPVVVSDAVTPDGYYLAGESRALVMTFDKTADKEKPTFTVSFGDVTSPPVTFRGVFASAALPKLAKVEFLFDNGLVVPVDTPPEPDANGNYVISVATLREKVAKPLVTAVFGTAPQDATSDPAAKMPKRAVLRVTPVDATTQKGAPALVSGAIDVVFKPR